ncbi:hypothetical protein PCAR4_830118 [Paraburkholderia caribensis]|nr:hypothetical protein PCAR4_830118 [Paraburkholderia caribensis]
MVIFDLKKMPSSVLMRHVGLATRNIEQTDSLTLRKEQSGCSGDNQDQPYRAKTGQRETLDSIPRIIDDASPIRAGPEEQGDWFRRLGRVRTIFPVPRTRAHTVDTVGI